MSSKRTWWRLTGALVLWIALPAETAAQFPIPPGDGPVLEPTALGERDLLPPSALLPTPPAALSYAEESVSFAEAAPITPLVPTVGGGKVETYALGIGEELPGGLELDALTGILSGTPIDLLPPTPYTIVASNAGGATSTSITIEVFGVAPSGLTYTPDNLQVEVGSGPYTAFAASLGGPVDAYTLMGPALPAGLVLDGGTGILSGLPRAPQMPTLHRIFATNETGSTFFDFLVQVQNPPAPQNLTYLPAPPYSLVTQPLVPIQPAITGRVDSYTISPPLPNQFLSASAGTVSIQSGVLLPDNPTPIPYTPPEQTVVHPWESLNVWIPQGTPPREGWPTLLSNPNGGYFGGPPYASLDPANDIEKFFHQVVNAGIAVVFAGTVDSGPFSGWFVPPGHPSGRWEDPNEPMAEKDFLHALQWVKTQPTYPLNPQRIFLHGSSSGATLAAYVGLGPELADPDGSIQTQASSRVLGVLCFDTLTSFLAYDEEDATLSHHWESVSVPGTSAIDMADADPAILDANSIGRILLDPRANAATTPCFLAYDCPGSTIDYANDPDGFPVLRDWPLFIHDLWNGAKLWERLLYLNRGLHLARSEFAVGNGYQTALGSMIGTNTGVFSGTVLNSQVLYTQSIQWMKTRAVETVLDPSGLVMHPKSGMIYGTPNTEWPQTVHQVTATNSGGSAVFNIIIEVSGG